MKTYLKTLPPIIHGRFCNRGWASQETSIEDQDVPTSHLDSDACKLCLVKYVDYMNGAICIAFRELLLCFTKIGFIATQEIELLCPSAGEGRSSLTADTVALFAMLARLFFDRLLPECRHSSSQHQL